jgi:Co/Zn/Cd efflux system component
MKTPNADYEKKSAALNSVGAAVFLTGLKVVVGVWSGSIGILAEAAHSVLDFVAALVTYVAVRAAGKPADAEHLYGHGLDQFKIPKPDGVEPLRLEKVTKLNVRNCPWLVAPKVAGF